MKQQHTTLTKAVHVSEFDEVITTLYESMIFNPYQGDDHLLNFSHDIYERREQILYYLKSHLDNPNHIEIAMEFANALLEHDTIIHWSTTLLVR